MSERLRRRGGSWERRRPHPEKRKRGQPRPQLESSPGRRGTSGGNAPGEERKRGQPRPQLESSPGALELRRVGADLISRVKADADATELQGDGEALGGYTRRRGRGESFKLGVLASPASYDVRRKPSVIA